MKKKMLTLCGAALLLTATATAWVSMNGGGEQLLLNKNVEALADNENGEKTDFDSRFTITTAEEITVYHATGEVDVCWAEVTETTACLGQGNVTCRIGETEITGEPFNCERINLGGDPWDMWGR